MLENLWWLSKQKSISFCTRSETSQIKRSIENNVNRNAAKGISVKKEKGVLKYFIIFAVQHLSFGKVACFKASNLLKKRLQHMFFY